MPSPLPAPHRASPAPALPQNAFAPRPLSSRPASAQFDDAAEVSPAILLEHLARVGMFEPSGGAAPAWEAAPRQKARGVIPLIVAIVLVAGSGIGGYKYAQKVKAERAERAATLAGEVSSLLHSGKLADLKATDEKLSRVFDLDSRSARAGRLWLENRVLGALLLNDELRGLDSAIYRGREVGLRERELAVGRVASFLVEGDLAGAAAQLPKWDSEAASDAFYQLAAGAVLERAGDARALERYDAARSLDAKLIPADLLLARLLLLEYGVAKARPVLDELAKKMPADDPNMRALAALSWVVDAERSAEPPESARLSPDDTRRLVFPLRAVPAMVEAATTFAKGDLTAAGKAIDAGLAVVDGPSLAATLGFLAIDAGNEALARKAALKALSFAALYPRARTLAARVALLGGRLEEAQKAVEELDPKSADVAVVRGVVAYETGDAAELKNALAALDVSSSPTFAGLAAGPGVLLASRYPDQKAIGAIALPSVPWGELVACDAALDTGNLVQAEKVLSARASNSAPVYLLRVARLRRYQKRLDDALAASQEALGERPTVALVIERVTELVEREQLAPARDLVARYPSLLGPVAQWLGVVLDVAANQPKQAAARLAQLDPPPDESPAVLRILAGRALVAAGDKRARPYLVGLVRHLGKHPDALAAAALLSAH
jgi:predicted negative regulator of RcsB-dependent stress response